jgi:asparagine synthase (glutamine-hydrolysing)
VGGIVGKLSFDRGETLVRPVLERMLDACRAEAPGAREDRAIFAAPGIALGWCAESDDTPVASTPAANEHSTIRAVADSALTNAAQLRAELERCGHGFRGRTDAEVAAHAYEEWGTRGFARFRGPFAFALWDEAKRVLIVARDHLGIRPMFFALLHGHGVVFATEVRALLQDPGIGRECCPEAIDAYLTLGYVPAPLSAYKRISKLEPAHALIVEGRRLHVVQYWDLPAPAATTTLDDVSTHVEGSLRTGMRRLARDHAGTALLYSGGTGSSVLLALAPRDIQPVVTVDLGHDGSELARSDRAAAHLGRARELEGATPGLPVLVKEFAARCGEPLADPAAVAQFAISVAARRHADYAAAAHGSAVLWPAGTRQTPDWSNGFWDDHRRHEIYTRAFGWQVRDTHPLRQHMELHAARDTGDALDRMRYVNAKLLLPDSILVSADRAAAASGLSLRFPFLDVPLVELAASLPGVLRERRHTGARPLRGLLASHLSPDLLPAARQWPPAHRWLRSALSTIVPSMLLGQRFDGRGIVSRLALARLWDEHRTAACDHSRRLWALVMLEFWFREFIDGDAAADEPLEYAVLKAA